METGGLKSKNLFEIDFDLSGYNDCKFGAPKASSLTKNESLLFGSMYYHCSYPFLTYGMPTQLRTLSSPVNGTWHARTNYSANHECSITTPLSKGLPYGHSQDSYLTCAKITGE